MRLSHFNRPINQVLEVAEKYVRPDEVAIVIVGDGAQVIEQLKPYSQEIEIYNTAGKRRATPAGASSANGSETGLPGVWAIEIETPFGQSIPATLTLVEDGDGFSGTVDSPMGSGEIENVILDGEYGLAHLPTETGQYVMLAISDALALTVMELKGTTAADFGLRHHGGYLGRKARTDNLPNG